MKKELKEPAFFMPFVPTCGITSARIVPNDQLQVAGNNKHLWQSYKSCCS